jgi:hypothetical protein
VWLDARKMEKRATTAFVTAISILHTRPSFHTWGNRRGIFPPEAHARQIWLCRSTPGRTVVEQYVALDVSLQKIAVCVLTASGRVVIEAEVAFEPGALIAFIRTKAPHAVRIGLESGPT